WNFVPAQRAVEKEVAKVLRRRRARGGDETAVLAVDRAMIEHRRRASEDEIDAALDVTMIEILPAAVGVERVLPAEESAVAEDRAIAERFERDGLPGVAGGVFEGDVLGGEIAGVDERAGAPAGPNGLRGARAEEAGVPVVGQHGPGRIRIFASETELIL